MNQPIPLAFPDFIYTEPTVAAGGGAEVVSLANAAWFTNNGFSVDFSLSSVSTPFGFTDLSTPTPDLSILRRNVLPVYSASGFDLLAILARVATRPNPRVVLGSVDLKCAFVVVDTRRFDHPIVYCSPSFCSLTGYSEDEIIGRNCRFLQSPTGDLRKADLRTHTSHEAVAHLRKSLIANKECQTTIRNFRKDGSPFMNLLTVIPLSGGVSGSTDEENEYVYHVGFQVDLAQQPNVILEKLNHGSYLVNYSPHPSRKPNNVQPIVMSKDLKILIADPAFLNSIPLSTSTVIPPSLSQEDPFTSPGPNHLLHMLLLESTPDFIHVVSLKGSFLYVAPSVRRVLGYEPDDMVGKAISDFAHPKDVVPLMRELKESSATGPSAADPPDYHHHHRSSTPSPKTVNLLFRVRTKSGIYIWVECRGRLHVEPGKGRKAIVLSGRARKMMSKLTWDHVSFAGGLSRGSSERPPTATHVREKKRSQQPIGHHHWKRVQQEVWGMISGHRKEAMTFLSVGKGVEDVLGWSADDLIGRNVMDLVLDPGARNVLGSVVAARHHRTRQPSSQVHCTLRKKGNGLADVWFILYREPSGGDDNHSGLSAVPLVYQIRLADAQTIFPLLATPPPPPSSWPQVTSIESSSSSSLAGAVPILNFSSTSTTPTPTSTSMDMFEELAISKGSSWQYELQQLRFANVRLYEELTALQVILSGGGGGETVGQYLSPSFSAEVYSDPTQYLLGQLEHTRDGLQHKRLRHAM